MKTTALLSFFLTASLFLFNGCEKAIFDITENFTFEHEFAITGSDNSFDEFASVNLSEEETLIEQYGSKIKKIEILEVKYHLKNHNGSDEQTLIHFDVYSANPDGSDEKLIAELQDINLSNLVMNPTVLDVNDEGILKLAGLIEDSPHTFGLKSSGQVNEAPVDFTVVLTFKARMTANPLN
ncbi:MAG: hypothetical protein ABR597_05055 [Bacteroidales bacterium]